jgi:AcrR family transcriptional regulator
VIHAAIELLDVLGEHGLTFRALAARLETGHGAIQWHIANKGELLKAATASVVSEAVSESELDATPRQSLRTVALRIFDVMDAHPWLGRQLTGSPWQPTILWIFELIGRQVQKMCTGPTDPFTSASALLTYIIGAGGRETANAQAPEAFEDRQTLLDSMASFWASLDSEEYAFTRSVAEKLRTHNDREVFLAGIDLILDGIEADSCRDGN